MNAKSTPGPWHASKRLVCSANGDAVAAINLAMPVGMAHANARLMAACKAIVASADDFDVSAAVEIAEAAIIKAEQA